MNTKLKGWGTSLTERACQISSNVSEELTASVFSTEKLTVRIHGTTHNLKLRS